MDTLFGSSPLDMATPATSAAITHLRDEQKARLIDEENQRISIAKDLEKKRNLLADPSKIDSMVANTTEDIFPFVKKPKITGAVDKTVAMDEALKSADHPLAGAVTSMKKQFKSALADPAYAGTDPLQLLDAVKKQHLDSKDDTGTTLSDRMNEFKRQKDRGVVHLNPFTEREGDKNVLALPSYEDYSKKKDLTEGPYHTTATEAATWGAVGTLVPALFTGGASAPLQLAGRVALGAALAIPEFKAFDAAANMVATSGDPTKPRDLSDTLAELAVGAVGIMAGHKIIKFGTGAAISRAVQAGKLSEGAVNLLGKTGLASDAIEAFKVTKQSERLTAEASRLATLETDALARRPPIQTVVDAEAATLNDQVLKAGGLEPHANPLDEILSSESFHTPVVNPDYLKAEGIGWGSEDIIHTNPASALYTRLSDIAEQKVFEDLGKGIPANVAVPVRFAQDQAIKKAASGTLTTEEFLTKANGIGTEKVAAEGKIAPEVYNSFINDSVISPAEGAKAVTKAADSSTYLGSSVAVLAAAGVAGGFTIFGLPSTSDASMLSSAVKAVGEAGKGVVETAVKEIKSSIPKVLDAGIPISSESLAPTIQKITNPKVKQYMLDTGFGEVAKKGSNPKYELNIRYNEIVDQLRELDKPVNAELLSKNPSMVKDTLTEELVNVWNDMKKAKGSAYFNAPQHDGSKVLSSIIEAADSNPDEILKTLKEMGIDTENRIVYHGTKSSESTLKGYDPSFTKRGIFNDEGEFAKYGASSPAVGSGYAGEIMTKPQFKTNLAFNLQKEVDAVHTPEVKAAARRLINNPGFYNPADIEILKNAGIDTGKYFSEGSSPNVQKMIFKTEKSYVMQSKNVPEDVMAILKEAMPEYEGLADHDATSAWGALQDIPQKRLETQYSKEVESIFDTQVRQNPSRLSEVEKQIGVSNTKFNTLTKLISLNDLAYTDILPREGVKRVDAILEEYRNATNGVRGANDILRSLGYDSITHVGRQDSLVTIALKAGVEKPFFDGSKIADNVLRGVVAGVGVGTAALLSLLSPSQAEASPLSAAGAVIPEVLKSANGTILEKSADMLKSIFENHWYAKPVKEGQLYIGRENYMEQVITAPNLGRSQSAASAVIGKRKTFLDGLSKYLSNSAFSDLYGNVTNSTAVQLASLQTAVTTNTQNALRVISNIAKTVPGLSEDYGAVSDAIAKHMKPFQEAYDGFAIPLAKTEFEINKTESVLGNLKAQLKEEGADLAGLNSMIEEQQTKLTGLQDIWHEYKPGIEDTTRNLTSAHEEMAKKYSTSRIALAVEDTPDFAKYPFLKNIPFSYEEKAAVGLVQDTMNHYKVRALDAGMDVIEGPYLRHSRDNIKMAPEFVAKMEVLGIQIDRGIPLTDFFSRSKYSQQMLPDVLRNASEYIPDAEKRINVANFWKVGKDGGWDAVAKNPEITSNRVWNDYFQRLKTAYNPAADTAANRWADRYSSLETLRLLAFLPSAPFKHLFKNEGTWATLGFANSMQHIPDAVVTSTRLAINNSLDKLGLTDKMLPKGAMDDFVNSVIRQRNLINPLSDIERHEGVVSKVDQWMDKITSTGSVGIQAVEAFDRVHTIQAAFDMSLKKGMTAEQAMSSIYSTILKNNFLGGALNPEWMHNPKIRALALFQNTPFKILERRVVNGMKTMDDVKTAFGIIRSQNLEATLNDLHNIRASVFEGQNELKKSMIFEAVTGTKDAFGNSISAQFVREWMIAGLVTMGGSAVGIDLSKHSFHLPFVKDNKNDMSFATSPIVDATWRTVHGGGVDQNKETDDKEFFPTRFYKNWLGSSGGAQPLVLHKMRKITDNDIPAIYKDSPLSYLFSIPNK